jgi:uncharacterized surface protein with fasciclin (FAS1) repeats
MKTSNTRKLSVIAAAVGIGLGTAALEAQEATRDVRDAADRLEQAEDRLDRAEQVVEQRERELEDAISAAADSDRREASDRPFQGDVDWDELVDEHADLDTFVEALRLTGLDETLAGGTAYTVFAPVDDAFERRRDELFSADNRAALIELLRAHIVADDVDPDRARTLSEALTVDGGRVALSVDDDKLMVGDAQVLEHDIRRGNVRIYAIDDLLDVRGRSAIATRDLND